MKRMFCLFIVLLFMPLFGLTVSAENAIEDAAKTDTLPQTDIVTEDEYTGKTQISFTSKIKTILTDTLNNGVKGIAKAFSLIFALLILSAVFKSFRWTSSNAALGNTYDILSVLVLSGASFSVLSALFEYASEAMKALNTYTTALLPVMSSLYALGGNVSASVVSGASTYLFLSVVEIIISKVLTVLLQVAFALTLVSAFPGGINLSSVSALVKNTVSIVLAFMFSLFAFVMYFQTSIAAAADNLAFRSVKFASGVFIPVIGSVIGESTRTLYASVGVIKTTVGAVGLTAMLAMLLPPIITVFLYKFVFVLCAAAAKMLALDAEAKLLTELNGILNMLAALLTGAAAVFLIIVAIFIKTGVDL